MCRKCGERVVRRLAWRVKYAVGPERVEPIVLGCMPSDMPNPKVGAGAGLAHPVERRGGGGERANSIRGERCGASGADVIRVAGRQAHVALQDDTPIALDLTRLALS